MSVFCDWAEDLPHVIIFQFVGLWTWSQFHEADAACYQWIQSAPKPVSLLLDFEKSTRLPPDSPREIRRLARRREDNLNLTVVVGVKPVLVVIGRVMARLFPKRARRVYAFATFEEGYEFLKEREKILTPTF